MLAGLYFSGGKISIFFFPRVVFNNWINEQLSYLSIK